MRMASQEAMSAWVTPCRKLGGVDFSLGDAQGEVLHGFYGSVGFAEALGFNGQVHARLTDFRLRERLIIGTIDSSDKAIMSQLGYGRKPPSQSPPHF